MCKIFKKIGVIQIDHQVLGQLAYEREARQHQSLGDHHVAFLGGGFQLALLVGGVIQDRYPFHRKPAGWGRCDGHLMVFAHHPGQFQAAYRRTGHLGRQRVVGDKQHLHGFSNANVIC